MLVQDNKYAEYIFYFILLCFIGTIFFSTPFLRLPYDVIAHLIAIDEIYHGIKEISVDIPNSRLIWHTIWAKIFYFLGIESTDFLLRTKIIHITQTIIAFFSIYFFSNAVIRNIFLKITPITVKYLSLWSVLIWFTIFSTFSLQYHQVWILWYSINYQITLPLFFYIVGLTIILVFEHNTRSKKIFIFLQILFISWFILQAHAMELLYYIMYLIILTLVYYKSVYQSAKKHPCWITYVSASLILLITLFKNDESKFSFYLMRAIERTDPSYLYKQIIHAGNIVVPHYNRASFVINEYMYIILYITILALGLFLWKKYQSNDTEINGKLFLFTVITSMFILIPLYLFPAGLFGLITRENVVHRIYYSASLFVLLPISIYYIMSPLTTKLRYINSILVILSLSVFFYSKYYPTIRHNYYKNIVSIENSFKKNKIGFNLSLSQIDHIAEAIKSYEKSNKTDKEILYFARYDIAFVLKYIYGKRVWWKGRKTNFDHNKEYWDNFQYQSNRYFPVLYRTHGTFPSYHPYK